MAAANLINLKIGTRLLWPADGLLPERHLTVTEICWRAGQPSICLTDRQGWDSWHSEDEIQRSCKEVITVQR